MTAVSRRDFLKTTAGATGAMAVGVLGFPLGSQLVEAIGPGLLRVTRTYARTRVGRLADLADGGPVDFKYPLEEHENFLLKLGAVAQGGVGPSGDVVAFSYLCSHIGCPLKDRYRHDDKVMGPCPCHFSTFDLTKNGTLVIGQATQSLPQIVLESEYGDVFAVGVTGLVYGYRDNLDGGDLAGTS